MMFDAKKCKPAPFQGKGLHFCFCNHSLPSRADVLTVQLSGGKRRMPVARGRSDAVRN